jgi:V-type H+-transporting ATPase subunit a
MPTESAWEILNSIGLIGNVHFIDYDPDLPIINRPFANYIKRCDEQLIKLMNIKELMKKFEKEIYPCNDIQYILKYFN